jgi:hypothetical protein
MKKIPFVDFPKDRAMDCPPPNGLYATISHNPGFHGRYALVPNALPWRTTIYEFKDGMADERGSGSDAGDMLSHWDVAKVFLIGLDAEEHAELNKTLAKFDIELVPDPAVEAENKRARDSFGPGFPLPVS